VVIYKEGASNSSLYSRREVGQLRKPIYLNLKHPHWRRARQKKAKLALINLLFGIGRRIR